jgi:putative nucleotidyltransferase with HDIG domain
MTNAMAISRDEALAIVREHVKNENLVKHMLCVEAAMRAYAAKYGEDADVWGNVGLLHDFDWEVHPQAPDHPVKGSEILKARGIPDDWREAILSHCDFTGVPRNTLLKKCLFACDELTGFLVACALVTPTKSLADVKVESVRKKMKDKSFARQVHREEIIRGAEELGVDLDEHIAFVRDALHQIRADLGLN